MDLKKDFNRLLPKLFWAQSEFGEHLATHNSNNVWKKYWNCGWFLQQVAKFVFNVRNLLFSQVSMLQADKQG